MKVLFQGRIGIEKSGGGDWVQMAQTASELRKLGVAVTVVNDFVADYSEYDLVHVFQLDWTVETSLFVLAAKKSGKKVVLSPIHHNISEVKRYDDVYAFGIRRLSRVLFSNQFYRDSFKNVYRAFFNFKKLGFTLRSLVKGLKNLHREAILAADLILVQTNLEAQDLAQAYAVEFEWKKVENGVSNGFAAQALPRAHAKNVLCVGRIEPRKNQLSVVKAMELLRQKYSFEAPLIFVGQRSFLPHLEYTLRFNRLLKQHPWIKYVQSVPYEKMSDLYAQAKVCVSASWFETTGLTSLEALHSGCRVVASGDRAREYLQDDAFYCNPGSVESISDAIYNAYQAEAPSMASVLQHDLSWAQTARKTFEAYEEVLKKA